MEFEIGIPYPARPLMISQWVQQPAALERWDRLQTTGKSIIYNKCLLAVNLARLFLVLMGDVTDHPCSSRYQSLIYDENSLASDSLSIDHV